MHKGDGLSRAGRNCGEKCFAASHFTNALRSSALALTLIPGPVFAAGFTCARPADSSRTSTPDELDEVVITGKEATTRAKDLQAWLKLLVGRYTYEGYVDLCGNGDAADQRPVTGHADCIGSRSTPTVQCTVNVRWPEALGDNGLPVLGGRSNLLPALVSYSLEKRYIADPGGGEAAFRAALRTGTPSTPIRTSYWGLMFTQVDSRGIAEWGSSMLVGDTFTSREPCVAVGMAGDCQKITRITAKPDSHEIAMVVDIKVDSQRVLRQAFLLHREPSGPKNAPPGKPSP